MNQVLDEFLHYFSIDLSNSQECAEAGQKLRYQIYCKEVNILPLENYQDEREIDKYDSRCSIGLMRDRKFGESVAMVRLVLAKSQYLENNFEIESHLSPQLIEKFWSLPGVERENTAEITRFAVSKLFRRRRHESIITHGITSQLEKVILDGGKRLYPHITIGLFKAIVELSARHQLTHWTAAMEIGLIRLLTRFGIHFIPLGPPTEYLGIRQCCYAEIRVLLHGIYIKRPDIWTFITDGGTFYPESSEQAEVSKAINQRA